MGFTVLIFFFHIDFTTKKGPLSESLIYAILFTESYLCEVVEAKIPDIKVMPAGLFLPEEIDLIGKRITEGSNILSS